MEESEVNFEDCPECLKSYYHAKKDGILLQYYLNKLISKRDDYLDDLPEEDVRNLATLDEKGCFKVDNYKCRGNYIVGLSLTLQEMIENNAINESELIEKIMQFRHYDFSYYHDKFTTKEEINMINQILTDTIEYLKIKKDSP
jgi:hypothetical protein